MQTTQCWDSDVRNDAGKSRAWWVIGSDRLERKVGSETRTPSWQILRARPGKREYPGNRTHKLSMQFKLLWLSIGIDPLTFQPADDDRKFAKTCVGKCKLPLL